jgi:hypothetical protein
MPVFSKPNNEINNEDISSILSQPNLVQRVAMGLIPGMSTIDKFGANFNITTASGPEDVWEGGGIYPFSTSADIISLSSSDASDTHVVRVQGLDENGDEVIQDITLTGQTRVPLTTPLFRVYRMENMGNADFTGTVYCYSGTENSSGVPSGASVTKAIIDNGNNQTLMAIYTIPLGKVGFLYRGEMGIDENLLSESFLTSIEQASEISI